MERSELHADRAAHALRSARRAYERDHLVGAIRGIAIAGALCVVAFGLHASTPLALAVASVLAATLGALGWRGGSLRRGAFAGVLAGLPPMIVSSVVTTLATGGHCASCGTVATWQCTLACLGTSALVGAFVGYQAISDRSPSRFAGAAITTAALTGLLGCATMGLGGALGVVIGLVAGGITGWAFANGPRTA
jgi:hypothetical protein